MSNTKEDIERVNQYKKLGLKELPTDKYLEIMENESFEDYTCDTWHQWFIYEGNLTISSEDFNQLDKYANFLITGNLIVDGVLLVDLTTIFVLGDVKAKNIIVESSSLYIGGVAYFEEALIVAIGDGQPIVINDTEGIFVLGGLDSADINVSKEKVKVFLDYSYCQSFGNFKDFLNDKVMKINEEGKLDIELDAMCTTILNNESILKK